jgi:8-oxo-dGTP diphosphatase
VLVCRRPLHKRHGGLWEFPGGKCEYGESDSDAIARELREELSVSVTSVGPALESIADPLSEFIIVFVPVCIEGEPECLEHAEIRWVAVGELSNITLAPSDRAFVQKWLPLRIP